MIIDVFPSGLLTSVDGQLDVVRAEEGQTPDVLMSPSRPGTGVMVELSASFSTALDGCSKALTVCTVLVRGKNHSRQFIITSKPK